MGDLKVKKRKLKKKDFTFLSHEDYKAWKKGLAAYDEEGFNTWTITTTE